MNEKIYKTMASSGAGSLALGIVRDCSEENQRY